MLTPEVTWKRWYILAVFYVISCNQSIFWITFSPIADESAKYFDVDYATVDLWLAWGPIIYIPVVFFLSWLQDRKGGMRHTMLLAAILDGVGMGIRCIALIQPTAWWAKVQHSLPFIPLPPLSFGPFHFLAVKTPPISRETRG